MMRELRDRFISLFSAEIWSVLKAILILALAFLVAWIVKLLVVKLLTKTKLNSLFGKSDSAADGKKKTIDFIGKLVYLLVFLLFVPGVFKNLGITEISTPITNILNTTWGYLPNILAAVVVLWIGFAVAKLVRELLVPVLNKIKINRLQEKAGIEVSDSAKLSNTLSYIVYALILIPVIITALRLLNIHAISDPAVRMLDIIFAYIPNIFAALIIIVVGCLVAKFAGSIVESLIASSGLDSKLTKLLEGKASKFSLSKVVGIAVNTVIVIFFIVESFTVLHLQVLSDIGSAVIGYMPYALAAVLILVATYVIATIVHKALSKNGHNTGALLGQYAIYVVGAFMVLNELRIATEIVNTSFLLIVAAVAVAFAIAFGIGGKAFAGKVLKKFEDKMEDGKVSDDTAEK